VHRDARVCRARDENLMQNRAPYSERASIPEASFRYRAVRDEAESSQCDRITCADVNTQFSKGGYTIGQEPLAARFVERRLPRIGNSYGETAIARGNCGGHSGGSAADYEQISRIHRGSSFADFGD